MGMVNRLGDARPIAMFGFDRLRETDIGGAHPELERPAAPCEVGLNALKLRLLLRRHIELAVETRMQFGFACSGRVRYDEPGDNADDGRRHCRQEQRTSG